MSEKLRVRWRERVYLVAVCLNQSERVLAESQWPGGIVDLARVLDPDRQTAFSVTQRRALATMVLRALGEPLPAFEPLKRLQPAPKPAPAVGAFAEPRTERVSARAEKPGKPELLDHDFVQSVLQGKAPKIARGHTNAPGVEEVVS